LLPSHSFLGASTRYGDLDISQPDPADRLATLREWIGGIDSVTGYELEPVSVDASFRRYFRLYDGAESFIVMDAPPPDEDCLPFVRIAGFLESMQIVAPRIVEADLENGFLLLTDLGSEQYLDKLVREPGSAEVLYGDAIDTLLILQQRGEAYQGTLPPYDEKLLHFELSLFRDWLCGTHLRLEFSEEDEIEWRSCCDLLVDSALRQPSVFVHRDYHSRNLMVMKAGNPGILDFQDAVEGPFTYDLVSLLKDCYICLPANQVRRSAQEFYRRQSAELCATISERQFFRYFELMGVQRQLKAAGIFCRLNHRDGKPGYLNDVTRTLQYIVDLNPGYGELDFLRRLIEERILPVWGATA
jgi:aminoglycoside/choline kinase family phosphotransferase